MQIKHLEQTINAFYLGSTTIFGDTSCSNHFLEILARLFNSASSVAAFKIYRVYSIMSTKIDCSVKFEADTTFFLPITAHPFKVIH